MELLWKCGSSCSCRVHGNLALTPPIQVPVTTLKTFKREVYLSIKYKLSSACSETAWKFRGLESTVRRFVVDLEKDCNIPCIHTHAHTHSFIAFVEYECIFSNCNWMWPESICLLCTLHDFLNYMNTRKIYGKELELRIKVKLQKCLPRFVAACLKVWPKVCNSPSNELIVKCWR